MFRIRFWPMTAKPISAMSALGSIAKSVKPQRYKRGRPAPADFWWRDELRESQSLHGRRNLGGAPSFLEVVPGGGHSAEFLDDRGKNAGNVVNFRLGIVFAEGDDDVARRQGMFQADGGEHRRDFQRLAHTGRSAGNGDALDIGHQGDAFAFDKFDADIQVYGGTPLAQLRPVQFD